MQSEGKTLSRNKFAGANLLKSFKLIKRKLEKGDYFILECFIEHILG
jgi:hypothetical protein